MILIKILLKIALLPLILLVTLVQWAGLFLIGFSSVIFYLFAGLCFLLSVLGYLMQVNTGEESIQMLIVGFVVFLIPHIGEWIVTRIAAINYGLRDFLSS